MIYQENVVDESLQGESTTLIGDLQDIPEYSVHLDAIRGGAASIVFLAHLHLFFLPSSHVAKSANAEPVSRITPAPENHRAGGHMDPAHQAVMAFFVLSGYLVGGSVMRTIRRGRWSWAKYLIHRGVRLWMVLVPALLLCLLLDTVGTHYFAGKGTIYSSPADQIMIPPNLQARLGSATFFGNLFFLQGILVTPFGTNQPLWSLANEFWYYIAFPLLALVLLKRLKPASSITAMGVLAAIVGIWKGGIIGYFSIWLMGALAAVLPGIVPPKYRRGAAMAAFAVFLIANMRARYQGSNGFRIDLLLGLVGFLLLYFVSQLRDPRSKGVYRSSARFLSRISYSLYLTHGPIFCFMSALLVGRWRTLPLSGPTLLIVAEAAATALLVACAVHFIFEDRTKQVQEFLEARL